MTIEEFFEATIQGVLSKKKLNTQAEEKDVF